MADLVLSNIYEFKRFRAAGQAILSANRCLPLCLLRFFVKRAMLSSDADGRDTEKAYRLNKKLAQILDLDDSQWAIPDITWSERRGHRMPFVLATSEQVLAFERERWSVQVAPQLVRQADGLLRSSRPSWKSKLPESNLCSWLRNALLHSPAHWYTSRIGDYLQIDFSTFTGCIEAEAGSCKFNVRDLQLTDDNIFRLNSLTRSSAVPKVTASDSDADSRQLLHCTFLALSLIQVANETSYHNWVHFYFNDLVLYQVQCHFPIGHWVRSLLDPHMRYQNVINNSGFFSAAPNRPSNSEAWDDVVFGGMLSCWSITTFAENIIDKTIGYYAKAELSTASRETIGVEFNLNSMPKTSSPTLDKLMDKLHAVILQFVGEVVDLSCPETEKPSSFESKELQLLALVTENVLKYLHKGCLDGLPEPASEAAGIKTRFKLVVARYILQAGLLHGLEHFQMYFWFAPLQLPQRIRTVYDPAQDLSEYYLFIDMHNSYHGHEMFTRYHPNADNNWNWGSLRYKFAKTELQTASDAFVRSVQSLIEAHDAEVYAPARKVLESHGIAYSKHCVLRPSIIPSSICM
eukprot:TRINITY_DN105805_c0_g1_i1.p1 TRINITY_DN105805_c0_g1~~TRINITY_DN105805_c0_g1_i1.p1  ORF type:complete len:604 (+),score=89.41 TRINITY_DN105805_c0_g1_i1:89-1813(+)